MDGLSALWTLRLWLPFGNSQVLTNVPENSRGSLDICWMKRMNTKWELFSILRTLSSSKRDREGVVDQHPSSLWSKGTPSFSIHGPRCLDGAPTLATETKSSVWKLTQGWAPEFLSRRKYEPYVLVGRRMLEGTLASTTIGIRMWDSELL